jgi:formylglycine-generating enzyme required for sulfatase activity
VRGKLTAPLGAIGRDGNSSESERLQTANILADYASDDPGLLADLLLDSEEKPFAVLFEKLKVHEERAVLLIEAELAKKASSEEKDAEKDRLAQRQARASIALLRLGQGEKVWTLLVHSQDPSLRSYIVNWMKPLGAKPKFLISKLEELAHDSVSIPKDRRSRMDEILFHPQTSVRRALLLTLGEYDLSEFSAAERELLVALLLETYRNDPDAGIHGAAEWTLRQWEQGETLKKVDTELQNLKDRENRRWYVNRQGQTLVVIEGAVTFKMGSPPSEPARFRDEVLHDERIDWPFAIAAKEVTREQYERFIQAHRKPHKHAIDDAHSPDLQGPQVGVTWYDAAEYCNWLSEQENLQACYEPNKKGEYAEGMMTFADFQTRPGYRLPTEKEWEYVCRAGTLTSRYYGGSLDLLGKYAWYNQNPPEPNAKRCGRLKPNELGLFDLLGNAFEWCHDMYSLYSHENGIARDNTEDLSLSKRQIENYILRGGAFAFRGADVRAAIRDSYPPWDDTGYYYGFRLARTYR